MAYSDSFPATRPVFQSDFANGGRIDPRITFSRPDTASSGNWSAATNSPGLADGSGTANQYYRVSAAGVQDLGSGSISFEVGDYIKYSGSVWFKTTQPISVTYWSNEKHLSSENLLLQSSDFDTGWSAQGLVSITGGQTDPSGGTDGWTLRENSSTGFHRLTQTVSASGEVAYTVYAKRNAGTRYLLLSFSSSAGGVNGAGLAAFDLAGGATHTANGSASTLTNLSATQTASGNGYYKCVFKVTGTITVAYLSLSNTGTPAANNYGLINYAADGSSSIDVAFSSLTTTGATDYNATTTQIHREYAPTLKSVSTAGQPRFEYSPTDSASMGLLIEGQAQNLAAYSSDFSNAAWTKTRTSVEANAAIGPDGTLSASLIRDVASTSNTHHVYQLLPSIASGTVVTASVFAKAAGRTFLIIQNGSTTPYGGSVYKVWFNLTAGTVGTISGSGVTASATDCGNGWTRCTVTFPASTSTSAHALQINSSEGDNDEYHVGDDYSGVLLYGAQYEQSSFGSSYIGTTSSAVTRAADSASVATADITGFSEGVGTIVCETGGVASATATNQLAFGLNGPASSNFFIAGVNSGGVTDTSVRVYSNTPDGNQAWFSSGTATVGTGYKLACRYELDNIAASMNGGAVVSDTSGKVPVGIDTLWIGELDGNYHLNSNLKRIAVYNEALSDTNLQALTS